MALALTAVMVVIFVPVAGSFRKAPSKAVRVDSIVASRSRRLAGVTAKMLRWCRTSFFELRKSLYKAAPPCGPGPAV